MEAIGDTDTGAGMRDGDDKDMAKGVSADNNGENGVRPENNEAHGGDDGKNGSRKRDRRKHARQADRRAKKSKTASDASGAKEGNGEEKRRAKKTASGKASAHDGMGDATFPPSPGFPFESMQDRDDFAEGDFSGIPYATMSDADDDYDPVYEAAYDIAFEDIGALEDGTPDFAGAMRKVERACADGTLPPFGEWEYRTLSDFCTTGLVLMDLPPDAYGALAPLESGVCDLFITLRDEETEASTRGLMMSQTREQSAVVADIVRTLTVDAPNGAVCVMSYADGVTDVLALPGYGKKASGAIRRAYASYEEALRSGERLEALLSSDEADGFWMLDDAAKTRVFAQAPEQATPKMSRTARDAAASARRAAELVRSADAFASRAINGLGALSIAFPTDSQKCFGGLRYTKRRMQKKDGEGNAVPREWEMRVYVARNGRLLALPELASMRALLLQDGETAEKALSSFSDEVADAIGDIVGGMAPLSGDAKGSSAFADVEACSACLVQSVSEMTSIVMLGSDMTVAADRLLLPFASGVDQTTVMACEPEAFGIHGAASFADLASALTDGDDARMPFTAMLSCLDDAAFMRALDLRMSNDVAGAASVLDDAASFATEKLLFDQWESETAKGVLEEYAPLIARWDLERTWSKDMSAYSEASATTLPLQPRILVEKWLDACSDLAEYPINVYAVVPQQMSEAEAKEAARRQMEEEIGFYDEEMEGMLGGFLPKKATTYGLSLPPKERPLLDAKTRRELRGLAAKALMEQGGSVLLHAHIDGKRGAMIALKRVGDEARDDASEVVGEMIEVYGFDGAIRPEPELTFFTL